MKKMKVLLIALILGVVAIALSSCEKEEVKNYENCFSIPSTKEISTIELYGCVADVSWSTSYGTSDEFTSSVCGVNPLYSEFGNDSVIEIVITGGDELIGDSVINLGIRIALILRANQNGQGYQIIAVKPAFCSEHLNVWGNNGKDYDVGVVEDDSTIVISSNGIGSPYDYGEFMCTEIVLRK